MSFVKRVTVESASVVGVLALGASWLAGATGGVGVLAGGTLALGNLWWLADRAVAASPVVPRWAIGTVLRLGALGIVVALVLGSGLAHPVGVVVGLSVLPCVLVARGLAAAREA